MKKIITTLNAPAPIGPYNQAVFVNDTLYLSGQIGLNPLTMELVEGDVKKEAEQVMVNWLLPGVEIVTSSLPLVPLLPVQAPDAEQDVALVDDQVKVTIESSKTEEDEEEREKKE